MIRVDLVAVITGLLAFPHHPVAADRQQATGSAGVGVDVVAVVASLKILIACGEVVVIDEEFGIRITEIVADGNEIG